MGGANGDYWQRWLGRPHMRPWRGPPCPVRGKPRKSC